MTFDIDINETAMAAIPFFAEEDTYIFLDEVYKYSIPVSAISGHNYQLRAKVKQETVEPEPQCTE